MGVTSSFVKPTHRPSLLRRDITQDVGARPCLRACGLADRPAESHTRAQPGVSASAPAYGEHVCRRHMYTHTHRHRHTHTPQFYL